MTSTAIKDRVVPVANLPPQQDQLRPPPCLTERTDQDQAVSAILLVQELPLEKRGEALAHAMGAMPDRMPAIDATLQTGPQTGLEPTVSLRDAQEIGRGTLRPEGLRQGDENTDRKLGCRVRKPSWWPRELEVERTHDCQRVAAGR